jgi:hypothetical protein
MDNNIGFMLFVLLILACIDAFVLTLIVNHVLAWLLGVAFNLTFDKALFLTMVLYIVRISKWQDK